MKRILILISLLVLAACSEDIKVHESIDKRLAMDSMQVLEIMEESIKDKEMPNEKDQAIIDDYLTKYEEYYELGVDKESMNQEIYTAINLRLKQLEEDINLDSGKDRIEGFKDLITGYIETGKTALEQVRESK